MDCLFFRHGIAIERQEWSGQDEDRPLTDKGAARTRESGKGLLTLRIRPTHILSSPLTRARETAAILQSLIRSKPKIRICTELDPTAAPGTLFSLLNALPSDAVVLCIGHEPHLSLAAGILFTGKPCSGLSLKKAGACLIHLDESVKPAAGRLEWWLTAAQLRALA
jgi:phosphohistidine phosphatase